MISHNASFYLNKTRFSRLHILYYSTPRGLKSGKMGSADAFWSSRARVVYIRQEEVNGFFILSDIWSFLAQNSAFQGPQFCLSKTKVCGAQTLLKTVPRQLQDSLKGPYREPLRASWPLLGSSWLSWALLGCLGAGLGSPNRLEQTQSWGPSEISEIVTTPTRELHFRPFMDLSWALLGCVVSA